MMAMKPRTFRRVVLIGSLCAIVLVLGLGYFVVRPWQSKRQLEAMRSNGIAAYEDGNFVTAVVMLGRYRNNVESIDPDILLKLARARLKVQAADGGHVTVAINLYREYLRSVPDDTQAALELLPLMNVVGLHVEARALAEGLLKDRAADNLDVLRDLWSAMVRLQASKEELEPVYRAAFDHKQSEYIDMSVYFGFLESNGRADERDRLLSERIAKFPGRVDEQVYSFLLAGISLDDEAVTNADLINELCSIIGLDPNNAEWAQDAPSLSGSLSMEVSRMFNILRAYGLSTEVLMRSALNNLKDFRARMLVARRLYWGGDDTLLAGLRLNTEDGEPDPDVLGYRYLSALRRSDQAGMDQVKGEMNAVVLDWRAQAWKNFIEGEAAFRAGDMIVARVAAQKAADAYQSEPTFHLLMGDVHNKQGRFNEAVEHWSRSNELANTTGGMSRPTDWHGWTAPLIRVIDAYGAQRRLAEAGAYLSELGRIGQQDPRAGLKLLEVNSTLARMGELSDTLGAEFIERWTKNKDTVAPETRALLAPNVATILAAKGYRDEARDELLSAINYAVDQDKLLMDIVEVDARYKLGVADQAGIDMRSVSDNTPEGALRTANRIAQEQRSTDAGLRYIDGAMGSVPEQDRDAWNRVRVSYLDALNDSRADSGWDALLAANPKDVELHYLAAESNAFRKDPQRVAAMIDTITQLTQTSGKTPATRLRLAQANSFVSRVQNRTNRDRALEIVRSVVSTEPDNTKARNMLGQLLAMPPSPGLPENERYARDFQGAVDQYTALARQLSNRGAQNYLLVASDLAFEMGDNEQAVVILNELISRFSTDWRVLPSVAERFDNMGQLQRAAEIYAQVARNFSSPDVQLALADLQLRLGNTDAGLQNIVGLEDAESLTLEQAFRLAVLFSRAGEQTKSQEIARNGERVGLSPFDAKLLLARYARTHLSVDDQIDALRAATSLEPTNSLAWRELIQRLIELDRLTEARASYKLASQAIPNDQNIERLGTLSLGDTVTGDDLLQMPGIKDNPRLEQAVRQVNAYTQLSTDAPMDQREKQLADLIDNYPDIEAVQSYAVAQLSTLPIDPRVIADHAERALKNAKQNTRIMGIAGEAAVFSNQPERAIRMVQLWRANTLERSVVAESIIGRAMVQLGQFRQAVEVLDPFVDEAFQTPQVAVHREVLKAYSFAQIMDGVDPEVVAARIEPLMKEDQGVRNGIWLLLAADAIKDPATGAAWIEKASLAADFEVDDDRFACGQAWVRLSMRHKVWRQEYAQRAIDLLSPYIERPESNVLVMRLVSTAYAILARSKADQDLGSDDFARAVELQLRAADLDPGNLSLLLEAAQLCSEGALHDEARRIYERLLNEDLPEGDLKASLYNNLAMSILRKGVDTADRDQLLGYVTESTRMAPNVSTFWGTRGWVELAVMDPVTAEQSFRTLIGQSPESAEGWTGLVITLKQQGPDQAAAYESAMSKLRQIHASEPLEAELMQYLASSGLTETLSEPAP